MIAQNFIDQKKLELKLEKSKYLPTLGANVNLGYNTFANALSTTSITENWNPYSSLGIGLSRARF